MDRLHKVYHRFFTPIKLLPAGVFNTQEFDNNNKPYRLHLRMEKDGTGILIVNARTVLHLNTTAAEYAYYRIQKTPVEVVSDTLSKRYRIGRDQAEKDFLAFCDQIKNFLNSQDIDPEASFGFERREPYSTELSAPMRLDCALTYHLAIKVPPGVTPIERVTRELTTEEWKTIFSKAWVAGVPHVIFTGGEPTLRPDLIDLIAHAEQLGQVSGVITNGLRLSEKEYLHALLEAGLDHFMILFDPNEEQAWEALRDVLAEEIHTTIHLTITPELSIGVRSLLERLKGMGVHTISLSAISKEFQDSLNIAKQAAADLNITLVWDLPVPYSNFHPIAMEMTENEPVPSGAGKVWLYVEPDGDVLKAQGVLPVLGNLLTDSWDYVWKHT